MIVEPAASRAAAQAQSTASPEPRRPGSRRSFSLSIDTGGTFTDGFVTDGERTRQVKVDTTPQDLTIGFAACVEAAAAALDEDLGPFLGSLERLHFSSTIATNTVVERRGASVGLIVTDGAQERLYGSSDQARILAEFVDPALVRGVAERVDGDGRVVAEPAAAEIEAVVRDLLERGVRLLVISFANADLNPSNERRARSIIDRSYPRHYLGAVPLLIASRVSLTADDFGRTATAVVNGYLHPRLARTLYTAEDGVRERGLTRPLMIVNTDGCTGRVAKTRAIDTYDSGPSAGVIGAGYVAAELGARSVCTFDVGGTTTDVALLHDGQVPVRETTDVGPLRIPHRSVAITSFGLGGGSVIRVDDSGRLRVGPQSAGAAPGPACFGLGGDALTPTDVWLLLGYLEPGAFLGGRRQLDPDAASGPARRLAEALGLDERAALLRARDAVHAELGEQLGRWAAGHPQLAATAPGDRWLFSYGGGGGLLCVAAADRLGIGRVVVFPHSSVFSAFGAGLLPIAHSYEAVISGDPADAVARLADSAQRDLRSEGVVDLETVHASLSVGGAQPVRATLARLARDPATSIAPSASGPCRLRVSVPGVPRVEMIAAKAEADAHAPRRLITDDGVIAVPTLSGLGQLGARGAPGPAFLQAPDTTIHVPSGWSIGFSPQGYGILSKEA